MPKYEVRRRRWPFRKPLKRPWELIRTSDMKPVGFYETPEDAESAKADAEAILSYSPWPRDLVKGVHPTGTMEGQDE